MSQYRLTLTEAMEFPLEVYLALLPAIVTRLGGEAKGPDFADRASMEARARCKRWLRRHFRILPEGRPGPANALIRWLADRQREGTQPC